MASKKPTGQWHFTVDYQQLNANAPVTAAVPNIAETVTLIQGAAHAWMPALDFKDIFFMSPLLEQNEVRFAVTQ